MPRVIREGETAPHLPEVLSNGRWYIVCPGCHAHEKQRDPEASEYALALRSIHCFNEKVHTFNGNVYAPTLTPSLLAKYAGKGVEEYCCHSFVRDGQIQFLDDCTHPLKGQTVGLMDAEILIPRQE
jgi:hypothetical protein